ncbi:MFS transporter [Solihabitans fulvus]|uniref:MFS transporter n=1 Tax=Solihabitans fulvus TaxID=1892852 RepID=A0A5B2WV82_9PSEU|nr:MFS transporter [Solihabitans fulvus]KAA2253807.1 MFS transporter [Solihabitans fulvus]
MTLTRNLTLLGLLRISGGRRYAVALAVDALGAGLLRPFLLLYGVTVLGMGPGVAGLALSLGWLAGLGALPVVGRWIDRGGRSTPEMATLLARAAGVGVLLLVGGAPGYFAGAVLLGLGNQAWPATHAAVVATLAAGRDRDAALAAARSLRNAGLGAGALIATVAVAGGADALRLVAVATAVGYLAAAVLVGRMRIRVRPEARVRADVPTDVPAEEGSETRSPRGFFRGADGLLLGVANLPYAFCFDVLEVALPALLVTHLHAAPAWSAGIFVANTVLVIATQVVVVVWLGRHSRRSVLAGAGVLLAVSYLGFWAGDGLGPVAIAVVSVLYTMGEILYTGSGTALVIATAPPRQLGRALARWQLSTGIGQAVAPAALTALLVVGPGALWGGLAGATLLAAGAIRRWGPVDERTGRVGHGAPGRANADQKVGT